MKSPDVNPKLVLEEDGTIASCEYIWLIGYGRKVFGPCYLSPSDLFDDELKRFVIINFFCNLHSNCII